MIFTSWGTGETRGFQLIMIAILCHLGFHISFKKLISPGAKIRFLGIDMDSETLELALLQDKVTKLCLMLGELVGKRKATRKQLERLAGLLAHCAKVVRGGHTFTRRVYDLIGTLREPF